MFSPIGKRVGFVLVFFFVLSGFLVVNSAFADDGYEPNNTPDTAGELLPGLWLGELGELGTQADEDWYVIHVPAGYERVLIDLWFLHEEGDIDVELFDSLLTPLAGSYGVSDGEYIDFTVPQGDTYYYIHVYGPNLGSWYDLIWNAEEAGAFGGGDDMYEENDTFDSAYELPPGMGLGELGELGIHADDDWYAIHVPAGYERVFVDLVFVHEEGDIDIALYGDSFSEPLAVSGGVEDWEFMDVTVPQGDAYYYIHVYGQGAGNWYDLIWNAEQPGGFGSWDDI